MADNQGVKHSFDFTSIVRSIATDADKNSNGHYLNEDVQKLLFHQIRWEIMYKKHIILLISIGLLTLYISCYFKWQYKVITSDVMAYWFLAIVDSCSVLIISDMIYTKKKYLDDM